MTETRQDSPSADEGSFVSALFDQALKAHEMVRARAADRHAELPPQDSDSERS